MKNWRELKRHPLSAEYRDLKGKALTRLRESLKKGFLPERAITLHDGMVLDGWQRFLICDEEGIEPIFFELSEDWTPEEYVAAVNDARRQETPDQIESRAKKRKARAAELRAEGMSTRQIAEELETSPSTVARDLAESTVPGGTPEQIKGRDGKLHPAKADAPKLCKNCKRKGPMRGCKVCEKLNTKPKGGKRKSGRPTYAWAMFRSGLATVKKGTEILTRQVDQVGNLYGAKESPKAKQLRDWLATRGEEFKDKFQKDFQGWYAELNALAPKG
jgi:transposase